MTTRTLTALLALALAFQSAVSAVDTSKHPGSINGALGTSASGAATYDIKLDLPASSYCPVPQIGISYNSQGGNGILGIGFTLTGLSSINRVPRTIYHDGKIGSVTNTTSDLYALDGNRLILKSGTYGRDKALYTTEVENFARITQQGTRGNNGANWFEVVGKDGTVYKYGCKTAKIEFDTIISSKRKKSVIQWPISEIEYTNGGEIEYEYLQEGLAVYVSQIRYDKNTIDFIYEECPDPIPVYYDGVKDKISKRLKEIVIKCNGSLYRKYEIKYKAGERLSKIESISESNSKGEHLNPTVFTWGVSSSSGMSEEGISTTAVTLARIKGNNLISADINGDGISDLIARSDRWNVNAFVTKKEANGTISLSRHTNFTIENCESYTIADMDGDGKQSLVSLQISKGQATFKEHINGSMSRTVGLTSGKKPVFTAADLNNDGKDELIYIETAKNKDGKYKCGIFSNMSGLNNFYLSVWNGTPDGVIIRDFDGDGLKDMIITTEKGHFLYRNNGNAFASMFTSVSTSIYYNKGKEVLYTGDFNGDNLEDILLYNPNSGSWCLYINQGRMIFSSKSLDALTNLKIKNEKFTHYDNDKEFCMVLDYDNDGKSDLLISDPRYDRESNWIGEEWGTPNVHYIYWLRSTGEDFTTENSCEITSGEQLTAYFTMGDFDGDGSLDVLNWGYNCRTGDSSSKKLHLYKNSTHNTQSDKIISVTNGLSRKDEIEYAPLSDESVYTPSASTDAKLMETRHLSVVKSITSNAGNSYKSKETFKYTGSRIHREGKGFMCFEKMEKTDEGLGTTESKVNEVNNTYYVPYVKEQSIVDGRRQSVLSKMTNSTEFHQLSGKIILVKTTKANEDNKVSGVKTTKEGAVDTNGNTNSETTSYGNDVTEKTTYTYQHFNGNGSTPNKVKSKTVTTTYSGASAHKTTTNYEYDAQGRVTKTTSITGASDSKDNVVTEYGDYNAKGQFCRKTVKRGNTPAETETYVYDSRGRMTGKTFSDGLKESYAYDNEGHVTSFTDVYGNTTSYEYDGWGNRTLTRHPDGTEERTATTWSSDNGATFKTTVSRSGESDEVRYYDIAGNETHAETSNISGTVCVDTEYDAQGRVSRKSKPYFKGGSPLWTTYKYDITGRLTEANDNGLVTTYAYNGLETTVTNPAGQTTTKRTNTVGDVTSVMDASGSMLTFKHNSAGNVLSTNAAGTATTMTYDDEDRQTSLRDADGGETKYEYRADGLMTKQTDANGNTTETEYDENRRVVRKSFFNKSRNAYDDQITYTYDAYGRLTEANGRNSREAYTYDRLGRMTRKETTADGKTYAFDYEYDELGNLSKKTYPFGYSLSYVYTNGELTDITDNKGRHIWHLDSKNAYGQTTGYTWGNGVKSTNGYNMRGMLVSQTTGTKQNLAYAYDERTGNMTSRSDVVRHQRETFEYDELNRLTGFTLWNNGRFNGTRTIEYAANGNIRSKDGAGEYSYSNRRPHAVAEVDGENDIPSATQTIEYNAFGKADRLTDDDGKVGLDIHYGIDGERVMCEWTDSTSNVYKKRLYFGECEITETDGVTEAVYYINAPDGLTAVMMHHGSTYKIYYLCTDHLGSITLLMNDAGNTVERHAYDAWGRKRNVNDWSDYNVENGKLDRGYTGHESLREFGLINMNGRMYDPVLGRMLSPDNYVQDPFDIQNYNRYTYCLNNPLKYTDPSGEYFLIDDLIAAAIGGVINLASNIISGNINGSFGECIGKGLAAFGAGAIGGVGAMYPEFGGWLWGGAVVGATNAWLSGADATGIVMGAGIGAISSIVGGAAGSWAGQHIGGFVVNGFNITSPVAKGVVSGALSSMFSGGASSFVGGYLMTGDIDEAWEYALNGMWQSAVLGSAIGGVSAYASATKAKIDPWTGVHKNSAILGEGMEGRVIPVAKDLQSEYLDAPQMNDAYFGHEISPNTTYTNRASMEYNAQWIEGRMSSDCHFYDIGPTGNKVVSPYYNMEQARTMVYPHIHNTYYKSFYIRSVQIRLIIWK